MSAPPAPTGTGTDRVPRLEDDPSIVKFVRTDPVQYEGDWTPDKYDPDLAQEAMESALDDAVEAERLGYDGLMLTEHHFDAWTLAPSPMLYLAALAARTSRLRLGQSVSILPFHNPWRLAEEAGMLDILSNGRAEIGVGKGNFAVERARYGLSAEDSEERFNEGIELLRRALSEPGVTFEGKFNRIDVPSTVYPKAFGDPLRPWVAGFKPESVTKIGREGDNLFGILGPHAGAILQRYLEAAYEAGHERSGANCMAATGIIVAPTDKEAAEIAERAYEYGLKTMIDRRAPESDRSYLPVFTGGGFHGSPSTVLDKMAGSVQASGIRRLILVMRSRFIPREQSRQTMHLFAEDVMPHLRHLAAQP